MFKPLSNRDNLSTFYTHVRTDDGEVLVPFHDGPFSQWWPQGFDKDGMHFPTAEHWMMYKKAELFGDSRSMALVLSAESPGEAKRVGRAVAGFEEEVWVRWARRIVFQGSLAKFSETHLRRILLETGGATIVEASRKDQIWGVGLAVGDVRLGSRQSWRGRNWLGEVLMAARYSLESTSCPGAVPRRVRERGGVSSWSTTTASTWWPAPSSAATRRSVSPCSGAGHSPPRTARRPPRSVPAPSARRSGSACSRRPRAPVWRA